MEKKEAKERLVSLRILDWDTKDVLAETAPNRKITEQFPTLQSYRMLFSTIEPIKGRTWHLMEDSCGLWSDHEFTIINGVEVYYGYAISVKNGEYWTQHDTSGKHKDGIREGDGKNGMDEGWKKYDPDAFDWKKARAEEYANALRTSPYFYYMLDTGSCQSPTQERVYRLFVDPNDTTNLSLDYWGNLGSTIEPIYKKILLRDSTDREHIVSVEVHNGRIVCVDKTEYGSTSAEE